MPRGMSLQSFCTSCTVFDHKNMIHTTTGGIRQMLAVTSNPKAVEERVRGLGLQEGRPKPRSKKSRVMMNGRRRAIRGALTLRQST